MQRTMHARLPRRPVQLLTAFAALLVLLLAGALPAAAQQSVVHVVQRGETLSKIARRYCTTWQEIYNMNEAAIGPNPSAVRVGTRLIVVDRCGGPPDGGTGGVWDRGPRQHATGTFRTPYYTVAWGDTLTSIGQRFGVSVQALRSANGISGNNISPGQALLIPGAPGAVVPPTPQPPQPPPSALERVYFGQGNISASRTGVIQQGVAQRYILGARAGQTMEIFTRSGGEGLWITLATVGGSPVQLTGANGQIQNALSARLPVTGDYIVSVASVIAPESPSLSFDITFVVR